MLFNLDQFPEEIGRYVALAATAEAMDLYVDGFHVNAVDLSLHDDDTVVIEIHGENEDAERTISKEVLIQRRQ